MHRYIVCTGEIYYPSRGMQDFVQDFENLEEANSFTEKLLEKGNVYTWVQIYDLTQKQIILEKDNYHI